MTKKSDGKEWRKERVCGLVLEIKKEQYSKLKP